MSKKLLFRLAAMFVALIATTGAYAQSYSNAVMALNPAGYWPLSESAVPSGGLYVATNQGSLGAAVQGYYETWWQTNGVSNALFSSNSIVHIPGAIVGDTDQALQQGSVGQYIVIPRTTNGVPNAAVTLTPPFTVEFWMFHTNGAANQLKPLIAEGFNSVVATNLGNNTVNQGVGFGMFNAFLYFNTFNGSGINGTGKTEIDTGTLNSNQWYHIVATFDGTSQKLYTNGVLVTTKTPGLNALGQRYVPDLVSPLVIGGGNELGISGGANVFFGGGLDEVAIYNTVLTAAQAAAHYQNGTNSLRTTNYNAVVTGDGASIYLRLDEPAFGGASAPSSYPVANNYGTLGAAASGYYLPGSTPGVSGPSYPGFGSSSAVALNGFNSGIDVGNGSLPMAFNPTNGQPVTIAAWFKGYPSDFAGRFQTLVGHSDSSWRLNLDTGSGPQFNPGNGPQLQFANLNDQLLNGFYVNDGQWHFVAGVSDGTNDSLYLDGILVKSGSSAGIVTNGTAQDLILGGDPQYTAPQPLSVGGGGRWFDGSIAQVAYFTNALSAVQIQGIYGAAGVPPSFRLQPASQALDAGAGGSIPAVVSGSAPIAYQWYFNGGLASGQISSSLTFASVTTGNAGNYFLVASNAYGAVTSSVVTLTVFQPNTYAGTVQALNPVAYWPLNESAQPPFGQYIATNRGTAGAAGNGYYESWFQPFAVGSSNLFFQTNLVNRTNGPINDGTLALQGFRSAQGQGSYVIFPRNTNGVPNPAVAIKPPFSIEFWAKPDTGLGSVMSIVCEGRNPVLDSSTAYSTANWEGFDIGQFGGIFFFSAYNNKDAGATKQELDAPITTNQWQHMVVTFDGTVQTWFKNGAQVATRTIPNSSANQFGQLYVPDLVSPLLIGTGTEPSAANGSTTFAGAIDEVAIYTNLLDANSIKTHYTTAYGTNTDGTPATSSYADTVVGSNPNIYVRLDEPAFNSYPSPSTYPVATNYGSVGALANGVYQPGATPGVAGAAYTGFGGGSSLAAAFNGHSGAVNVGGGNMPVQLNPTGTQPLTVAAWFQANPADAPARFQNILGHGNSSWRITMDNVTGGVRFNPGNGPELQFTNFADVLTNNAVANDGQWHFVAGVSDGSTASLYLDGRLVKTAAGVGSIANGIGDAFLGGDPASTVPVWNTANTLRYFDGQVAQISYYSNALTALQIQQMYNAAGVPLAIIQEPPAALTNNVGSVVSISVPVRGSSPVYQWYQTNTVTSVITPVSGQTTSALTFNPASLGNNGFYFMIATNAYNAVTSSVVQLVVVGPPQLVQSSPSDIRVFQGTTPTLHMTVIGPSPVFQWTSNNVVVGASANYTVNTGTTGTTAYTCVVTNSFGAITNTFNVSVQNDPVASYPVHVLADTPVAYFRLSETDNGSGNNGSTCYDFAGGNNGIYTNTTLGQPGYAPNTEPTNTAAEFGDFPGLNPNNDYAGLVPSYLNFGTTNGGNAQFSVEAWVQEYLFQNGGNCIVAMGLGGGGEQFVLDTGGANASVRFFVRNAAGTTASANAAAIRIDDSQWHHMVGVCDEAGGHVYLYLDGVQVASGTIAPNSGLLNTTVPLSIGARQSNNTTNANDYDFQFLGKINDVAIYGSALSQAQVQAHYFNGEVAPKISSISPTNQNVNQGGTATIAVAANGSSPLSYQWMDPSFNIVGNSATLTLTNLQPSQAGTYTVQVSNAYGSASTNAVVNVNSGPPVILVDLQPTNQTVFAGTPVTLYVVVSGTPPFTYQWYRNGSPIVVSGPTNTFNALQGTNSYQVAVTNGFGGTNSAIATVIGFPVTTLNPSNYTDSLKISFAGYNRSETLSDFPVLVRLSPSLSGFNYSHFASASGGDLRFTDSSGTRVIPHEIDQWNPSGESLVWVQVSRLSSTNDSIWAYWGNGADTTPPAYTTNGSVWVPQTFEGLPPYDVVYHLKESGFPYADSSLQYPALTGLAAPTSTAGIVGTGESFNNSQLDAGTMTNIDDAFTVSAWVNINSSANNIQSIWANKAGGGTSGFGLFVDGFNTTDQSLILETGNGSTTPTFHTGGGAVSFGVWHLITASINRTNAVAHLYVDGSEVAGTGSVRNDFSNTNDVNLGTLVTGSFPINGLMDEARIHGGVDSSNWVWASYMTVAQNAALQSYSSVTSSVAVPVVLSNMTFQVTGNSLILSGSGGAGAAGRAYQVLTATNVMQPISEWIPIATNVFDGSGNFSATNTIDRVTRSRFFRVAVPQ